MHLYESDTFTPHKQKFISNDYPSSLNYDHLDRSHEKLQKLFAVNYLDGLTSSPLEGKFKELKKIFSRTKCIK